MAYSEKQKEIILSLIFQHISEDGFSLRKACKNASLPPITFYEWIDNDNEKAKQYARACEERADLMFEDILHIADDTSKDTKTVDLGGVELEVLNSEHIQRSKTRIDARKWMLSKMNPKKYGDRTTLEHEGTLNLDAHIQVSLNDKQIDLSTND